MDMKISDSARDAILNVMKSQQLDPHVWYFELLLSKGAIGIGFTKQLANAEVHQFGELRLAIDQNLDTTGILLDFAEVDGKKGLIFGADNNH